MEHQPHSMLVYLIALVIFAPLVILLYLDDVRKLRRMRKELAELEAEQRRK